MDLIIDHHVLVYYVDQKLLLVLLEFIMGYESSVDVLVDDLIHLPALAAVNRVYEAFRGLHSLCRLLYFLVRDFILGFDNVYEL